MTAEELQGGAGAASFFENTFEIGSDRGASRGIVNDRTYDSVEGERSEAVQKGAGPIGGDIGRTSVSESEACDKESRNILRAKLKAVWASNRERARSTTAANPANLGKENHADANFIRSKAGFAR